MTALVDRVRRYVKTFDQLAREFRLGLIEKGPRFLWVAITANLTGMGLGYFLFRYFTPLFGITVVSLASGVLHVLITYSSHFFITFQRTGHYFRGLWKVYLTAWMGMVVSGLLNQFLIGSLQLPYFVAQALILCFGASYSLLANFLFIFRRRSS